MPQDPDRSPVYAAPSHHSGLPFSEAGRRVGMSGSSVDHDVLSARLQLRQRQAHDVRADSAGPSSTAEAATRLAQRYCSSVRYHRHPAVAGGGTRCRDVVTLRPSERRQLSLWGPATGPAGGEELPGAEGLS